MKNNQKYTQEEMYLAIELWKESGLSQEHFCQQEKISSSTFSYWLRKYRQEKEASASKSNSFVPVELSPPASSIEDSSEAPVNILISYPNGIRVNCPESISTEKLIELIKL